MKWKLISALGCTSFVLSGCAIVYEGQYHFNDGWREAEVMEVASDSEIKKPQFSDCRESAARQQPSTGLFVVLSYKRMERMRTHVAPLKPNETLRPGDLVYANVTRCDIPLVPRVRSVIR